MKKIVIFSVALVLLSITEVFSQTVTIKNMTSYGFNISLCGHDATYTGCGGLTCSPLINAIPASTTVGPLTIENLNVSTCPSGGIMAYGWGAGCGTNGPGCGWDAVAIAFTSCGPNMSYSLCSSPAPSLPVTAIDCMHNTIYLNWVDDGLGNITITVHN